MTAVLRLAATEAQRMLLHPVNLILGLMFVSLIGFDAELVQSLQQPDVIREGLEYFFLLYYGLFVLAAVNLVATSARRSGADSQLEATPVSAQARTLATCLGVFGPAGVAALAALGIYALTYGPSPDLDQAMTPAELLVIPLCALGAGLLGVAVAQWLPWPGAALVAGVAMVVWVAAAQGHVGWAWSVPWTASSTFDDSPALLGGSQALHAIYLAGLGTLAALVAVLRSPGHRQRLLAATVTVAAATVAAGTLQLP